MVYHHSIVVKHGYYSMGSEWSWEKRSLLQESNFRHMYHLAHANKTARDFYTHQIINPLSHSRFPRAESGPRRLPPSSRPHASSTEFSLGRSDLYHIRSLLDGKRGGRERSFEGNIFLQCFRLRRFGLVDLFEAAKKNFLLASHS